jgi:uncharacterized membrane protein
MKERSLVLIFAFLLALSCKKKKDDTCTYTSDIQPIVANKCALAGCHAAGSAVADFSGYEGLKTRADNGKISKYVFELKIMPPATKTQLTDEEKEKLKCWLDGGAKQD